MLRPDSADYADILGDVAIGLIAEGGMPAITMRSLAEQFRVTPQRVHSAFGDRAHLERVLMIVFIRRWRAWIARREPRDGVFALLPSTTDEIVWSRVWLALCELARVRDDLSPLV
jgi:AcrR family transcriptional regulator